MTGPAPALTPGTAALGEAAGALREQVREFLVAEHAAGSFTPQCDVWLSGWDPDFSRKLGQRGWVGMTLPTEYGGHGRSALARSTRSCGPCSTSWP